MLGFIDRSVARRIAVTTAATAAVASAVVGVLVVAFIMDPGSARNDVLMTAILGGATTVVCVLVATVVIVNRLLSSSLHGLTHALKEAEKGRWLRATGSERPDEIGELGRAFDRLAATVTDLRVAVIDTDRELEVARGEIRLKEALQLLFSVSQSINAEPNVPAVLSAIPELIGRALGFEQMAVLIHDEATQEFVVRAAYGIAESALGVAFPRNDAISGAVADTGEPLIISDTARDARYSRFKGTHPIDGAFASIPMKAQGRLVGLFNVLRPGPASITEADIRLLSSLAGYAGLAIANAEATSRLRSLAVTDDLTGVANRRALMARLRDELERSRRSDKPAAALMVDLDHFKRVNDELGHLAGDDVLRRVAQCLRENIRRIDLVARYGGEEFVVLLPDCDVTQASVVAEKLRAAVVALDLPLKTTISIGVAAFPTHADADVKLLDAADRALLQAKRAGRNRVVQA